MASPCDKLEMQVNSRKQIWTMNLRTVQTAVGWNLPAAIFFFPLKSTGNLHIDKAITSHNKKTSSTSSKSPSDSTLSSWCVTFYSTGAFACESVGFWSIFSGNNSFSQTVSLIGKCCDISLGSVKREGGTCIKLAILLSRDVYSRNM